MEDGKKKTIMIVVAVICLSLAVVILVGMLGDSGDIKSFKGQLVWVKCYKPECGTTYQIDKKEYFEYIREHQKGIVAPPMVCEKCKEESAYRVMKCEKCGHIFESSGSKQDFLDRCPECGYSKTEEERKRKQI